MKKISILTPYKVYFRIPISGHYSPSPVFLIPPSVPRMPFSDLKTKLGICSQSTNLVALLGKEHVHVSAENLLSCCYSCGFGCNGGTVRDPGRFWSDPDPIFIGPELVFFRRIESGLIQLGPLLDESVQKFL